MQRSSLDTSDWTISQSLAIVASHDLHTRASAG